MVFCHEWLQVRDGTVCAVELTPDLSAPAGEPFQLWSAAAAPWVKAIRDEDEFVTDGPFLLNLNGKLASIWSSFDKDGYVEALATSEGGIRGPWSVDHPTMLSGHDGGHGMLFTDFDGQQRFVCHQPNQSPKERPALYRFENGVFCKD